MGNKNFFFRINPCEVLAEAIFSDDKEKWFLQFFNDLKNDDLDSATMPITKRIIAEAHSFRAKRSIAGKVSAEKRDNKPPKRRTYVKHMLPNDEQVINTDRTSSSSSSSNNSSTETKKTLKPLPPESLRLSGLLADWILKNNPTHKDLSNGKFDKTVTRWAEDIDKMMRLDGRTESNIEMVINWCQVDSFWKVNILSGATLRKQYDKMILKATPQEDARFKDW